jgi:hypothetical protein
MRAEHCQASIECSVGADFGVAIVFMWRTGPAPVDIMTNFAPDEPVHASTGACPDRPFSLNLDLLLIHSAPITARVPIIHRKFCAHKH